MWEPWFRVSHGYGGDFSGFWTHSAISVRQMLCPPHLTSAAVLGGHTRDVLRGGDSDRLQDPINLVLRVGALPHRPGPGLFVFVAFFEKCSFWQCFFSPDDFILGLECLVNPRPNSVAEGPGKKTATVLGPPQFAR